MCAVPTTRDYLVKELKPDPDCNFNLVRMSDACRLTVQYPFLVVPYNDFERHPRLVSC